MKKILALILILSNLFLFSQSNDSIKKVRNGIAFLPNTSITSNGLAIGFFGYDIVCYPPVKRTSNGINIQIPGQGFMSTFYIKSGPHISYSNNEQIDSSNDNINYSYKVKIETDSVDSNKSYKYSVHNGLIISLTGTFTKKINGISLSPYMSMGDTLNGVSFNLLWNFYQSLNGISLGLVNSNQQAKGVQIGLFNNCGNLRGFQIGLWNKNGKRSLPLINWTFK